MDKKRNYIVLVIGVICLGLLLTGGTYAWLLFDGVSIGNNKMTGNTTNFIVDYTVSLNGMLFPSKTDKGGLSGTVNAIIDNDSDVENATCGLYLYADENTSSILYEGTEKGVALKYAVYNGNTLLSSGKVNSDITKTGVPNGMIIYDNFNISYYYTTYYNVYLWLDGELSDNRYLDLSFSGSINLKCVQGEDSFGSKPNPH